MLHITASGDDADSGLDRIRVILDGTNIHEGASPWELDLGLWDLDW